MFQAIAAMSKNPEAMAKAIVSSMNKSFEELIKALKELAAANTFEKVTVLSAVDKETMLYLNLARMYPAKYAKIELVNEFKKFLCSY